MPGEELVPGLARLPRASRAALLRLAAPETLRKGRALYYQGERADRAYLLTSGALRRLMYRSDESTAELGRSSPGDWVGLAEAFMESLYLTDAVAETASSLLAFSRQGIARALESPGVGAYLLGQTSRQLYALHCRLEVNLPLDRTIRFLVDQGVRTQDIAITQEQIAAAVGLTRETVNRHLSLLQDEGLILVSRGLVRIIDMEGFRSRSATGLSGAEAEERPS